jgi:hypothetical protein
LSEYRLFSSSLCSFLHSRVTSSPLGPNILLLHVLQNRNTWFQTFTVFCMLYVFFWVILRPLNFICRRFGTLCLFHLHRQVGK